MNDLGGERLEGYQLRYIYFIDKSRRKDLTVPEIPFSEILKRGAGMYKGEKRVGGVEDDAPAIQAGEGGSIPTPALQNSEAKDG